MDQKRLRTTVSELNITCITADLASDGGHCRPPTTTQPRAVTYLICSTLCRSRTWLALHFSQSRIKFASFSSFSTSTSSLTLRSWCSCACCAERASLSSFSWKTKQPKLFVPVAPTRLFAWTPHWRTEKDFYCGLWPEAKLEQLVKLQTSFLPPPLMYFQPRRDCLKQAKNINDLLKTQITTLLQNCRRKCWTQRVTNSLLSTFKHKKTLPVLAVTRARDETCSCRKLILSQN